MVSIKFLSTLVKTMTLKNSVIHKNTVLYNNPPQSKEPQPRHPYLNASKIGVNGFSSSMALYFSGAALNG